ncbi:DUF4843 domain-containing protein [Chitinophaga arvensicola]|uniref:DUF4843 domain-containing protein n=1 Tax=Chitinophaga arvensicola TaxID=29529 RepID=A0A1I0S8Z3_9BACT|nr:DUF4843 domain-containing protein [Chitinophaga arvensicola]SEW52561.1 protein of unknown function [Chitinophaga arvensicola]
MYKKISLLLFISGIIVFFSCKKSTIAVYNANSSVYFHSRTDSFWLHYNGSDGSIHSQPVRYAKTANQFDTLIGNMGLLNEVVPEVILESKVWVTGQPVSHDRRFQVVVDKTSTLPEGDFTIDEQSCIIRAGASVANMQIRAKKSAIMKKMPLYLTLTLTGGDGIDTAYAREYIEYQPGIYKSMVTRTFGFYDNLPQPVWWPTFGKYYLGDFSNTKLLFLCNHFNIPMTAIQDKGFNTSLIMEYGRLMRCYLRAMSDKQTPVMDKNDYTDVEFPMAAGAYASSVCDN